MGFGCHVLLPPFEVALNLTRPENRPAPQVRDGSGEVFVTGAPIRYDRPTDPRHLRHFEQSDELVIRLGHAFHDISP
ncbi:hypothetical protein GCM10017674_58270 [Streptomyces gardneri]|uniref:Uncharacterized protein n=1 Tax=Streptomyces gardneri TaxID=66892 RepID=A0A4Y3RP14_9ACTN|nr:hypothetical protein SGA01_47140 [Streptomyces gardneri]GHH12302.1 hypothetical protein GCM10017674_58270 [Streptomyces gardneri]